MCKSESTPLLSASGATKPTVTPPAPLDHAYGYRLMALSTIGTATSSFFLHVALARYAFPVRSALLLRAVVQSLFAASHLLLNPVARRSLTSLTHPSLLWLSLRGLLGAVAMAFYFQALKLLPVGDAATIVYLHPIFAMLIAHVVLAESASLLDVAASLASVAGVFLVAGAHDPASSPLLADMRTRLVGSCYALASAFSAAVAFVIVRGLGLSVNYMTSILALGLSYVVVALAMAGQWGLEHAHLWKGVSLAALSAVCGIFSQCYTNKGLQYCPAGAGQVVRTVAVVMTYFLGVVFLHEGLGFDRLCGAALVIGAAGLMGWVRARRSEHS